MEFEVRPFEGSLKAWFDAVDISFGQRVVEEDLPVVEAYTELERALAAYDGERVVGTAGIFSFDLTVPGGPMPAAGVTMVGVHPAHLRPLPADAHRSLLARRGLVARRVHPRPGALAARRRTSLLPPPRDRWRRRRVRAVPDARRLGRSRAKGIDRRLGGDRPESG